MASMFYTNATATFTMSNNMGGLRFNTSGTSDALNIASNGAATFLANSTTLNVNTSTRVLEVIGKNNFYATQIIGGSGTGTSYGLSVNAGTNSSDIAFQVYNQSESAIRLFVRGDGNVGIGTSSPSTLLQTNQTGASGYFYSGQQSGTEIAYWYYNANEVQFSSKASSRALTFLTNDTERMRITSGGNVLIGTSSVSNQGTLNSYTNNANPAGRFISGPSTPDGNIVLMVDKYSSTNTTSQWFLGFTISNQGVASGVITANGASQAAFGSWSDRRLKENIADLQPQLNKILALRPVEFDYIQSEGGGHQISFIAQEFEEVYPDAVGERQDGMKTLTGWGKTESILVKGIQELHQLIQEQQAQIEELKELIKNK
jgi:hypothetical protein